MKRWIRTIFSLLGGIGLTAAVTSGCSSHRPAAPRAKLARKAAEAWISAKSFCVLPLAAAEIPRTGGQLTDSLLGGWKGALRFTDPAKVVTIVGGHYPAIDSLRVDLSDATVLTDKKGASLNEPKPTTQSLGVDHFTLLASPLLSHKAKLNLQLTGEAVKFDVQKDKSGSPLLMMADASSGTLHFDASTADLEKLILAMAKEMASKNGIIVRSVNLKLTSAGPRSIDADLHLSTLFALIPAGLRFTAHVDVDDQMNAKISNLNATGDEILGPLITELLRPALSKYDGKSKLLINFPNEKVKLKTVQIDAGERVTLDATFGR